MRSEASAPNSSSASPATASVPPMLLGPHDAAAIGIDAADRRLERARADACRRCAAAGPTRSASRSTSLAPRGEPTATSQRTRRRAVRVDARHARPLADDQRVLERGDHAGLRQRQRIAGPLHLPELGAVERIEGLHRPVDAEDEDALAGDQRRGRDADAERLLPLDLAGFERDQLAVARHHRGDAAVAADAGGELGADVGAPDRAAARRPRARRRCRRSPASVNDPAVDRRRRAGTATLPMLSLPDLARAVIGATIGSQLLGLGRSGPNRFQLAGAASASDAAPAPTRHEQRRRRQRSLGCSRRRSRRSPPGRRRATFSLASTRRR